MQNVLAAIEAGDLDSARTRAWELVGGKEKHSAGRVICYCAVKSDDAKTLASFIKAQPEIAAALPFEKAYCDFREGRDARWFLGEADGSSLDHMLLGQIFLEQRLFRQACDAFLQAQAHQFPLNLYAACAQVAGRLSAIDAASTSSATYAEWRAQECYDRLYQFYYNKALYQIATSSFSDAAESAGKALDCFEKHATLIKEELETALKENVKNGEHMIDATRARLSLVRQFAHIYMGKSVQDQDILPLLRRIRTLEGYHPSKKEAGLAERLRIPLIDGKDPYLALRMMYKSMIVVRGLNFGARVRQEPQPEVEAETQQHRRRGNMPTKVIGPEGTYPDYLATGHKAVYKQLAYVKEAYIDEEQNTPEFTEFLYAVLHLSSACAGLLPPGQSEPIDIMPHLREGSGNSYSIASWLLLKIAQASVLPYVDKQSTLQQMALVRMRDAHEDSSQALAGFDYSLLCSRGAIAGLCSALLELGYFRTAYRIVTGTLHAYLEREHAAEADDMLDCLLTAQRTIFLKLVGHRCARGADYETQAWSLHLDESTHAPMDAYLPEACTPKRDSKPMPTKWQPKSLRKSQTKAVRGRGSGVTHQGAVTDRTEVSIVHGTATRNKRRR